MVEACPLLPRRWKPSMLFILSKVASPAGTNRIAQRPLPSQAQEADPGNGYARQRKFHQRGHLQCRGEHAIELTECDERKKLTITGLAKPKVGTPRVILPTQNIRLIVTFNHRLTLRAQVVVPQSAQRFVFHIYHATIDHSLWYFYRDAFPPFKPLEPEVA